MRINRIPFKIRCNTVCVQLRTCFPYTGKEGAALFIGLASILPCSKIRINFTVTVDGEKGIFTPTVGSSTNWICSWVCSRCCTPLKKPPKDQNQKEKNSILRAWTFFLAKFSLVDWDFCLNLLRMAVPGGDVRSFRSRFSFMQSKSDEILKETNLKRNTNNKPDNLNFFNVVKNTGPCLQYLPAVVVGQLAWIVLACRCNSQRLKFAARQWRRPPSIHRTLFSLALFLLMNWSEDNFPAERWSTWKARARCQLHVISIKCGWALSIKKTQGNLWLLKEIPLARSQPERRPFVPRHVSHTFRVQISSGFMKPCFIFAHCNVSLGSGKYGEALSTKS